VHAEKIKEWCHYIVVLDKSNMVAKMLASVNFFWPCASKSSYSRNSLLILIFLFKMTVVNTATDTRGSIQDKTLKTS